MATFDDIAPFDETFVEGDFAHSPFLTPRSRHLGKNLPLKSSLAASLTLLGAFTLSFFPHLSALSSLLLLFTYFFAGVPPLISTLEDLLTWEINIDMLMVIAAFASLFIGSGMEGGLLLVLFAFSGALEISVQSKAKGALNALKKLAPTIIHVIQEDGTLKERALQDISVGTLIFVKAGEVVPLDGTIIEGSSFVSLTHLTGESIPLSKKVGESVPAGARNCDGALTIEVTHTSNSSTLAQIIQLIMRAQNSKPALQTAFDKLGKWYALAIITIALSIAFLIPTGSLYRALTFLIAASPCALILALPIAYFSALNACARRGILLKGGAIFDGLAKCSAIALDKTGTLTQGDLHCCAVEGSDETQAIAAACALEQGAVHPLARALVTLAQEKSISPLSIENFRSHAGFGLEAEFEGKRILIGNEALVLPKLSPEKSEELSQKIAQIKKRGELYCILLMGEEYTLFRFQEILREGVKEMVSALQHKEHVRPLMLTGDHHDNAQKIAKACGIQTFFAELRPEDKLEHIATIAAKEEIAMVGDGINDSPALARATVGISMGKVGSQTAIDTSDVIFLQDNLEQLPWLFAKARKTKHIVHENILLAFAAIVAASLPALLGWIPLWLTVILHEGGTVLVGLNALRLLKR